MDHRNSGGDEATRNSDRKFQQAAGGQADAGCCVVALIVGIGSAPYIGALSFLREGARCFESQSHSARPAVTLGWLKGLRPELHGPHRP
jgi:hypothetical protein